MREQKLVCLAYAAGIVDGEGCISITRRTKGQYYTLQVVVANTNEWLVNWFRFNFGGHVYSVAARKRTCKISYQWIVSHRTALDFLIDIEPFLQIKRPHAIIAIEFQRGQGKVGAKRSPERLQFYEDRRLRLNALNLRGDNMPLIDSKQLIGTTWPVD